MTRRRRSGRLLLRAALLLFLIAGSTLGWWQWKRNRQAPDLPMATARQGAFPVLVHCRGELTARRNIQLSAPSNVPNLQIVWLAPSGGEVKAGDVVIRFDASRAQQDLKEKQAALTQAQASLDQALAQARITEDQDKLESATARYQVEKARLEASKQAIVSVIQGQESVIDQKLAEEKLKVQQAGLRLHRASDDSKIASQKRLRDEMQREVDITKQQLAAMEIRSPLHGVIVYLPNFSQGWMNAQPFKVGDHAASGQIVAEIPDLSTLQIESRVEEIDRGRIAPGNEVRVHVDAFPEKVVSARLDSVSPLTEQSFTEWPPTRSFKAYATLLSPDPRMRPGMNAAADVIETTLPKAISVPAKAIFTRQGRPVVYVKEANAYLAKNVKVLARNPDEVAIEGLAGGTQVTLLEPPAPGAPQ